MHDFVKVTKTFVPKLQRYTYKPSFQIRPKMRDLDVRSRDYRALYDYKTGMWIPVESEGIAILDEEVYEYVAKEVGDLINDPEHGPIILKISDTDTKLIDAFHKFCQRDVRDNSHMMNQKIIFSNTEVKREDYATYRLDYPLQEAPIPYYEKLVNTLYLPEERQKFEWMVGAIIAGEQSKIQKLFVFYGLPGSGKSTVIDRIFVENVFGGYGSPYVAKFTADLLGKSNEFATDFLSSDPVLAFDDDADLSRIESNATLNLIASHEPVRVNTKYGRPYVVSPNCFLVCGTNKPVQLSPESGLNRRVIDIRQTGEKLPPDEYDDCIDHLKFEKSGIAWHCLQVYKRLGKNYYNRYVPEDMLLATSAFHNYVKDSFFQLKDGITLANAYSIYKTYCEETNLKNVMVRHKFRDLLRLYFDEYHADVKNDAGKNYFSGFKYEKIGLTRPEVEEETTEVKEEPKKKAGWLELNCTTSLFDKQFADCPAQYSKADGSPKDYWENVTTKLSDLDTTKEHYIQLPPVIITMDFDLRGDDGETKSLEKNIEAANKFPKTYAELSKSGVGIHLEYKYTGGNPDELSAVYGDNIEIKVMKGNAALRRRLTYCNDVPIAEISSGLPLREAKKKMVDWDGFKNERILRATIANCLAKTHHGHTKPEVDYIYSLLKEAYESGLSYDVRDMYQNVRNFADLSTNKSDYCTELVSHMHFVSDDILAAEAYKDDYSEVFRNVENAEYQNAPIVIFDIESYPEDKEKNMEALLVICWKYYGKDKDVVRMINPEPREVEELFKYRLIGFNNRDYDNHILWARSQGMTIAECNRRSNQIINAKTKEEKKAAKFGSAYNISYTDILDFAAASNKQSLKKWEIELDIHHQEMGIPWDQAVPPEMWDKVADYCTNDVLATEAVFNHLQPDFVAREILADLSGLTVNDTTNQHTIQILTHDYKDPNQNYIYTDLSTIYPGYEFDPNGIDKSRYKEGVKIVSGKSIYKGIDPGEGGRKIGYPGMYTNIGLFDVASMHPSSMIKLQIFGKEITKRLENLVKGRIAIKHKDYEKAISLLGEKTRKYLTGDPEELKKNAKALANALKTAINSVYGLTSASFPNKLRDPRNIDNIVAKYGALFMVDLEEELTNMGYTVVHVSTDSIKVANVDLNVANYIQKRGLEMGFTFEWEAVYEKMTLVNDAVYIAKFMSTKECESRYGFIPEDNADYEKTGNMWSATGAQFKIPYVFKTLFSHEQIIFKDMCETFNVREGAIHLDFNENLEDSTEYDKWLKKLEKIIDSSSDPSFTLTKPMEKFIAGLKEFFGVSDSVSANMLVELLKERIASCHNYQFIGRVGQFTPIISGHGGGALVCIRDGKPNAVSGSKKPDGIPYRWLESETMTEEDKNYIDRSYYRRLVDDAKDAIEEFGSFEFFVGETETNLPKDFMNPPIEE